MRNHSDVFLLSALEILITLSCFLGASAHATRHCDFNTPPIVLSKNVRTQSSATQNFTVRAYDRVHHVDFITDCRIGTPPKMGSAIVDTDCVASYTSDADYVGADTFTVIATDTCDADSDPGTVQLTVIEPCGGEACYALQGLGNLSSGRLDNVSRGYQPQRSR